MATLATKLSDSGGGDGVPGGGTGDPLNRNSNNRNSIRKVLPSVPDMDQQLSMATKMIDRRTSTKKGNHSYAPYFLEYSLLAEYDHLQKQLISGMYVLPSASSALVWFGVLFVREGLYQEGVFRFALHIPQNFPDGDVPSVIFETPVFHPLVNPETGEIEIKRGFANKWRRNVNHLWHVLLYVRRAFYKIETAQPLNPEAAVLYESDAEMFERRVRTCVQASIESAFNPPLTQDLHAIHFTEYQPALHDPIREELRTEKKDNDLDTGLSWVQPGSLQIFSKTQS